jgi:two-component system LytT family response regulator
METPIKTVIVDDESPAREIIMEYLADTSDVEIKASFGSPAEAIDFLSKHNIDLLFLDIQMPQMTGFELVEQLETIPEIIFSTAYDQYAIRAFELNAIDYLLKPYTKQRFEEALSRVRNKQESEDQRLDRIQNLVSQAKEKEHYPSRMFVRVGSKIVPVVVDDIIYVKADGDYSNIHTSEHNLLCSTGLGNLEDKLNPDKFMRVHRSYIIAIDKINNLESDGGGGFTGIMSDGSEIKVSRSRAEKIKKLLI